MLGLKELVLLGLVFFVLYGRSGLPSNPYVRALRPWLSPRRRPGYGPVGPRSAPVEPRSEPKRDGRFFWFLTILAAAAVAAWVVTRILIAQGTKGPS